MRRSDREVTEHHEILNIIDACEVIHLGLVDDGIPYIIPLNFGYKAEKGVITFYLHSAKVGRKLDILKKSPHVCFEMERVFHILGNDAPCSWTTEYESIIGYGEVSFVIDEAERIAAMDAIMQKQGYSGDGEYQPEILCHTVLYQLRVSEISGKRNGSRQMND